MKAAAEYLTPVILELGGKNPVWVDPTIPTTLGAATNQDVAYVLRREDFYLRYYIGHKGRFGHEFLEFEIRDDGRLRYANNSQYKAENLIRKEVWVNELVVEELKRIITESEILK